MLTGINVSSTDLYTVKLKRKLQSTHLTFSPYGVAKKNIMKSNSNVVTFEQNRTKKREEGRTHNSTKPSTP